jgi:hypothetical protein
MNRMILAAIGLLAPMALLAVPANSQAVRNYDCAKAGNANKAVCKSAAAAAAKPAPKALTARNYDCSKAGNANKAVCKSAAAAAKPTTGSATTSTAMTTRHYDCTKAGNANKAACKGTIPMAAPARPAAPVVKNNATVTQRHTTITTNGQNTNAGGPNGATAKCRDGTESFSAHRSGTCSRHGGVAQFY